MSDGAPDIKKFLSSYRKAFLDGRSILNYLPPRVTNIVETSEFSLAGKLEAYKSIIDTPVGIGGILGFEDRNPHLLADSSALAMYVQCCVAAVEAMKSNQRLVPPGRSHLDPLQAMTRVCDDTHIPEPSPKVAEALARAAKLIPDTSEAFATQTAIANCLRGVLFALPESFPDRPDYQLNKAGLLDKLQELNLPERCPSALTIKVWAERSGSPERRQHSQPTQLKLAF